MRALSTRAAAVPELSVMPATAMKASRATESHETLSVMALEWLSERGHSLELQRQCEEHKASGRVRAPPAP